MNQRIRELANQMFSMEQFEYAEEFLNDEFLEKFAEMIVKECAKVIVNGGYWSGGPLGPKRQCTPPEIAQMIKEHFGVD